MNRIARRSTITILLVAVLIAGFAFFLAEFILEADQWVISEGSPHVYNAGNIGTGTVISQDGALLANERQLTAAKSALDAVNETLSAIQNDITFDAVTVMIDSAIGYLCELSGESVSESVVNEIFSKFCVGK